MALGENLAMSLKDDSLRGDRSHVQEDKEWFQLGCGGGTHVTVPCSQGCAPRPVRVQAGTQMKPVILCSRHKARYSDP